MNECCLKERERIKGIVRENLEHDFNQGRLRTDTEGTLKPASRQEHLISHILFNIDDPDYVRKTT